MSEIWHLPYVRDPEEKTVISAAITCVENAPRDSLKEMLDACGLLEPLLEMREYGEPCGADTRAEKDPA